MAAAFPPALHRILDMLRCPVCGAGLAAAPGALRCPAGHTFDLARQGYASLLSGARSTSGDDAQMAQARDRFLTSGIYGPIRDAAAAFAAEAVSGTAVPPGGPAPAGEPAPAGGPAPAAAPAPAEAGTGADSDQRGTAQAGAASGTATVVDAGGGTGWYLAGVLDALSEARGLCFDTSTRALRVAARAHERAAAVTWDVFKPLPLADHSADVLLNIFAPRSPAEFHRVLSAAGRLIVVRPTDRHLAELRAHLPQMIAIDPQKEERLDRALGPHFSEESTELVEYSVGLSGPRAVDLVGMTPSARHMDGLDPEVSGFPSSVTVSVLVTSYRPR